MLADISLGECHATLYKVRSSESHTSSGGDVIRYDPSIHQFRSQGEKREKKLCGYVQRVRHGKKFQAFRIVILKGRDFIFRGIRRDGICLANELSM